MSTSEPKTPQPIVLAGIEIPLATQTLLVHDLVDPREGTILSRLFPLDRAANADGRRAVLEPRADEAAQPDSSRSPTELPPLLKQILAEYSATGLPPAYLPKNPSPKQAELGGAE